MKSEIEIEKWNYVIQAVTSGRLQQGDGAHKDTNECEEGFDSKISIPRIHIVQSPKQKRLDLQKNAEKIQEATASLVGAKEIRVDDSVVAVLSGAEGIFL